MAESAVRNLRGLVLSAAELSNLNPEWSDAMIEDYLTILENLITVSEIVDQKQDILRTVVNINPSDSPYLVNDIDQKYVFDTDLGDIVVSLNAGVNGRMYVMTNVGTSGNKVTVTPDGTDLLYGENGTENIYDSEALNMTFESEEGWWD